MVACTLDSPVALQSAVLRAEALRVDSVVAVRASWIFGALVQDFFSWFSTSPHHIAQGCFLGEQGWIVVASWGWWPGQRPACLGLAAGRKLCAPGGGRAAGSALRTWWASIGYLSCGGKSKKSKTAFMGKVPRLVNVAAQAGCLHQRGCVSGRPLRTTAVHSAGRDGWRTSAGVALQVPAGSAQGRTHLFQRAISCAGISTRETCARAAGLWRDSTST
jgi:hypothetical protein